MIYINDGSNRHIGLHNIYIVCISNFAKLLEKCVVSHFTVGAHEVKSSVESSNNSKFRLSDHCSVFQANAQQSFVKLRYLSDPEWNI